MPEEGVSNGENEELSMDEQDSAELMPKDPWADVEEEQTAEQLWGVDDEDTGLDEGLDGWGQGLDEGLDDVDQGLDEEDDRSKVLEEVQKDSETAEAEIDEEKEAGGLEDVITPVGVAEEAASDINVDPESDDNDEENSENRNIDEEDNRPKALEKAQKDEDSAQDEIDETIEGDSISQEEENETRERYQRKDAGGLEENRNIDEEEQEIDTIDEKMKAVEEAAEDKDEAQVKIDKVIAQEGSISQKEENKIKAESHKKTVDESKRNMKDGVTGRFKSKPSDTPEEKEKKLKQSEKVDKVLDEWNEEGFPDGVESLYARYRAIDQMGEGPEKDAAKDQLRSEILVKLNEDEELFDENDIDGVLADIHSNKSEYEVMMLAKQLQVIAEEDKDGNLYEEAMKHVVDGDYEALDDYFHSLSQDENVSERLRNEMGKMNLQKQASRGEIPFHINREDTLQRMHSEAEARIQIPTELVAMAGVDTAFEKLDNDGKETMKDLAENGGLEMAVLLLKNGAKSKGGKVVGKIARQKYEVKSNDGAVQCKIKGSGVSKTLDGYTATAADKAAVSVALGEANVASQIDGEIADRFVKMVNVDAGDNAFMKLKERETLVGALDGMIVECQKEGIDMADLHLVEGGEINDQQFNFMTAWVEMKVTDEGGYEAAFNSIEPKLLLALANKWHETNEFLYKGEIELEQLNEQAA